MRRTLAVLCILCVAVLPAGCPKASATTPCSTQSSFPPSTISTQLSESEQVVRRQHGGRLVEYDSTASVQPPPREGVKVSADGARGTFTLSPASCG